MRPGARRLALAGAAAILAAAAALALRPETVLELENAERGRTVRLGVAPGERFTVVSRHSMYDAPVSEEFAVGPGGAVVLEAVSSPSAAAREYFGLTGAGERHAVVRPMREIVFRVAMGAPQRLRLRDRERSFLELGAPGDRVLLRVARHPALSRWLALVALHPS